MTRRMEKTVPVGNCSGECAAVMPEKLALGESLRHRAAVHGDEREAPPFLVEVVDRAGQHLFAGARLPFQEDGDVADRSDFVRTP